MIVLVRIATVLVLGVPAASARAGTPVADPCPALERALGARPLDCDVLGAAFSALVASGRQACDVASIARARGSGAACATAAADDAAGRLGVPPAEVVQWLLANPGALEVELGSEPERLTAEGLALDCGLVLTGKRLQHRDGSAGLVLELANTTGDTVTAYDLVARINGQPWRSAVRLDAKDAVESPIGAGESLAWNVESESWEDVRQTSSRTWKVGPRPKLVAPGSPVPPGRSFEAWVRLSELPPGFQASDFDVSFESCTLTTR